MSFAKRSNHQTYHGFIDFQRVTIGAIILHRILQIIDHQVRLVHIHLVTLILRGGRDYCSRAPLLLLLQVAMFQ